MFDQVDVLRVPVRDHDRVLRIPIDEQHLKLATTLTVEEQMVRVHWEARHRWLEKDLRS